MNDEWNANSPAGMDRQMTRLTPKASGLAGGTESRSRREVRVAGRGYHRWWVALLLVAAVFVDGVGLSTAHAARLALLIGIDDYAHIGKLRNARADAQTMADALRTAGYQVEVKTDRTQREMLDDVRAFRQRIQPGDEVVFFFSGHAVQIGATNHLLPANVRNQSEEQVRDDALELNRILTDIRGARPAFTLAIVDACRDNPFAGPGRSLGGRGLTGVAGANGQMVIYAAGEGQQALDRLSDADAVRNGLFTRVFVREMVKPGLPVHEVLRNVRVEVARLAQSVGHVQVPAIYDQVIGEFFFVAGDRRDRPTAPVSVAAVGPTGVARPPATEQAPDRPAAIGHESASSARLQTGASPAQAIPGAPNTGASEFDQALAAGQLERAELIALRVTNPRVRDPMMILVACNALKREDARTADRVARHVSDANARTKQNLRDAARGLTSGAATSGLQGICT